MASAGVRLKTTRASRICAIVVGIVAPPGVPMASSGLPPRSTITGDSGDAGRFPAAQRIRGCRRVAEIVHRVVEREAEGGDAEAGAGFVAGGRRQRDDVAVRVDDRDMRRVRRRRRRGARLGERDGRRDAIRIDRRAPERGAFIGEEIAQRHAVRGGSARNLSRSMAARRSASASRWM